MLIVKAMQRQITKNLPGAIKPKGLNMITKINYRYVCFVDRCLSFCTFSFGHCVVCSSSIYGFWLPLWYLQTLLTYAWCRSSLIKITIALSSNWFTEVFFKNSSNLVIMLTSISEILHNKQRGYWNGWAPEFYPVLSGVHVTRSLVLCVCFVDRCVSFCTFSLGHSVDCSSIYGFWLPLWYLQALLR